MGYFNKPDLTDEILKGEWCYTGDVGRWDDDGFLIITDRKKDLIITSGGKNISPQNIENMIKQIPLVSNALVHGDQRKYLTALITLDEAETKTLADERGISYTSYDELIKNSEITGIIEKGMGGMNENLAKFETIKKFSILPRDFLQEEGEITPTLKVKRKVINERYRDVIDSMYDE
jgi:long-chain acyl-CoA synthetase